MIKNRNRTGTVYLLVVFISVLVSVTAFGAILAYQSFREKSTLDLHHNKSGNYAKSSVSLALSQIQNDRDWATNYSSDTWHSITVANNKAEWKYSNESLAGRNAFFRLAGKGRTANATRYLSLSGISADRPLDVLRTAIHCSGNLTMSGEVTAANGPLSCDQTLAFSGNGKLYGSCEAPTIPSTSEVTGQAITGVPVKTMPTQKLFELYRSMATHIDYTLMPTTNKINDVTINSSSLPTDWTTNPLGIYLVTVPANTTLTIENCEITASLIIELDGVNSQLVMGDGVIWNTASNQFPALLVYTQQDSTNHVVIKSSGHRTSSSSQSLSLESAISYSDSVVSESITPTPVTGDEAKLNGLFHVIRNVAGTPTSTTTVVAPKRFTGCVIADGDVIIDESSHFVADRSFQSSPPLGYTTERPGNDLVINGDFSEGAKGWNSQLTNSQGLMPDLSIETNGGANEIQIANRTSANAGMYQDVTIEFESGLAYTIQGTARMESLADSIKVLIQWEDETGTISQIAGTSDIYTTDTNFAITLTPNWTQPPVQIRLAIQTNSTNDPFTVSSIQVTDPATDRKSNFQTFPSTWKFENAAETN